MLDVESDPDFVELQKGHSRIALKVEPGFDRYLFIEHSKKRVAELEKLKALYPGRASNVLIEHGDANTVLEKFKLGADLYDDGIRWLKQIIRAEQPNLSEDEVNEELDRRKAIKRRVDEARVFRIYVEDVLIG